MFRRLNFVVLALLSVMFTGQANANALNFFGTFTRDDNIAVLAFQNLAAGTVTIESFSYAGGTHPVGRLVAAGGFDPVFGLYNFAGQLIAVGDDGASRIDPVTSAAFDSFLSLTLGVGTYFIALGQYDNYPIGSLVNGFLETGAGNFTAAFGCSNGRFCDVNGFNRTGNYDIAVTGAAVVPEPATIALLGLAFAGGLVVRRRRIAA